MGGNREVASASILVKLFSVLWEVKRLSVSFLERGAGAPSPSRGTPPWRVHRRILAQEGRLGLLTATPGISQSQQ